MTQAPLKDRLKDSAVKRAEMLNVFGMIPMSILKLSRGQLHKSMYHLAKERNRRGVISDSANTRQSKQALEKKDKGVFVAPYAGAGDRTSVSIMAAELVDFVLKYYLPAGGVYLDPFVGQGVQAQVAALRDIDYYGMDLAAEYVDFTNEALTRYDTTATIEVVRGDSRNCDWIEDSIGDVCFTSPPYWDIEFYSDDEEQLGLDTTYDEFLNGMRDVFTAWHSKFKKGATVVINVNDFRRDGVYYPYHADTMRLLTESGYTAHDIWIVDGLVGGLPRAFAVDHNRKQVAPKVHEYLLVYKA